MATRTWDARELPILEAVIAAETEVRVVTIGEIASRSGLTPSEVAHGLHALHEDGYVSGSRLHMTGVPFALVGVRALGPARRATGQWPSEDPYAELLAALEARIAGTADTEARTRLERLRDAAAGVGRDVLTGVLTAAMTAALPK